MTKPARSAGELKKATAKQSSHGVLLETAVLATTTSAPAVSAQGVDRSAMERATASSCDRGLEGVARTRAAGRARLVPQICLGLLVDRSIAGTRAERITERDEGNGPVARQTPLYLEIDRWADIRRAWFVIL